MIENLIMGLLSVCWAVYVVTASMLTAGYRSVLLNRVWLWTKWPALVDVFANPVAKVLLDHQSLKVWDYLFLGFSLAFWWRFRNAGDDDEHKRLKKRISGRVKELAGRLVVVPAPAT